jgi:hypothetical protein
METSFVGTNNCEAKRVTVEGLSNATGMQGAAVYTDAWSTVPYGLAYQEGSDCCKQGDTRRKAVSTSR